MRRLISSVVWDCETSETRLNIDKEYAKVADEDPNVIMLIDAAQMALANKCITAKNGQTWITTEKANEIIINAILSLRHLIIRTDQVRRLHKEAKKDGGA